MSISVTVCGTFKCWFLACVVSAVSVLSFQTPSPGLRTQKQGPHSFPLSPRKYSPSFSVFAAHMMSGGSAAGRIGSFGEFVDLPATQERSQQKPSSHPSKRQRRRKRAPPSELQQWLSKLGTLPGGLKLLLDLDNNADAVVQLEEADIENKFRSCEVRGFAGFDYCGPEPGWLPIHRCNIRTKNGADFVLAFWAGRLVEAALSEWAAATAQRQKKPDVANNRPPMIVIVSADAGMEVVAGQVRAQGLEAHVVRNVGELGTLLKALDVIEQIGPGVTYVKPPLSGLDTRDL